MDHRAEKTPKKHQKMLKTSEGVHGDNKSQCVNFVHFDYSHLQNVPKFQFYFLFRYYSYQNHLSH